jgi:pimeloyl-ACP methyl ester carboxylesterase
MEDISIPVPGGEVSVWRRSSTGDAATVVLVHGLSGNSRWWGSVVDHLPRDLGVIALDVRGRGESVDAPPPYDLATIAGDIDRALDHFDIERAVVAGYSMGGWVAALFGLMHAERVERLLLVDGGFPMPRDPKADVAGIIDATVGPSLRRLEVEFDSEAAFYEYWKGHPALERHWDDAMKAALGHELVALDGHFAVRANPEAIQVGAREITVGEEANQAGAKLEVPTHLIVVERGTTDQPGGMIPLEVAEKATAANPNLSMEYLEGLNHYTLILGEGASAVASAVVAG